MDLRTANFDIAADVYPRGKCETALEAPQSSRVHRNEKMQDYPLEA
jgi:hypothetical protein